MSFATIDTDDIEVLREFCKVLSKANIDYSSDYWDTLGRALKAERELELCRQDLDACAIELEHYRSFVESLIPVE